MSKQTETARRDAQKSGCARCAMPKANVTTKPGRWRNTRRKGVPCLVSPEGRVYYGTAQEVRDAALTPTRRDMLASELYWARDTAERFGYSPEDRRAYYAAKRRDAMHYGAFDFRSPCALTVTARDYLLLNAGMRLVGYDSFPEYVAEVVQSQIEALLDVAQSDTGKREIPLTRHERAALARLDLQEAARAHGDRRAIPPRYPACAERPSRDIISCIASESA